MPLTHWVKLAAWLFALAAALPLSPLFGFLAGAICAALRMDSTAEDRVAVTSGVAGLAVMVWRFRIPLLRWVASFQAADWMATVLVLPAALFTGVVLAATLVLGHTRPPSLDIAEPVPFGLLVVTCGGLLWLKIRRRSVSIR